MSEIKNFEQAKATFETLCKTLDNLEWHYESDEERLSVECGAQGEDLPMKLSIQIDAERMLAILISHMPFVISEDKRLDVAIAVSAINNMLADGCFDFDIASGRLLFRMTNSFIESKLGEDIFAYLLLCSCKTIDEYNDKFFMLGKGALAVEQFLASLAD